MSGDGRTFSLAPSLDLRLTSTPLVRSVPWAKALPPRSTDVPTVGMISDRDVARAGRFSITAIKSRGIISTAWIGCRTTQGIPYGAAVVTAGSHDEPTRTRACGSGPGRVHLSFPRAWVSGLPTSKV